MAKIGIMSFAHIHAFSYADCLNKIDKAQFTGIWDDSPKRGRDAAKQFKTKFVKDLDTFLSSDIEGVIITSENVKHREMVERAAAAGKWILCEKPIAPGVKDAKAIIRACKKAKVGLGTAFPCRFAPALITVRDQVASGNLGEIYAVNCTNNGQFPGGWFAKEELAGGGATMDHTVHVADVLRWMTGKEFTSVYCENDTLLHKRIKTDDLGSLHLEMEGGIKVSHIASWSRSRSFPFWGDVYLEIIGEKGVIEVDTFDQKLDVYNDDVMKAEWVYWGGNPDLSMITDFVESVDARRPPAVSGEDGLRAVEVTVAAYRSARSRRPVKVGGK